MEREKNKEKSHVVLCLTSLASPWNWKVPLALTQQGVWWVKMWVCRGKEPGAWSTLSDPHQCSGWEKTSTSFQRTEEQQPLWGMTCSTTDLVTPRMMSLFGEWKSCFGSELLVGLHHRVQNIALEEKNMSLKKNTPLSCQLQRACLHGRLGFWFFHKSHGMDSWG